MARSVEFPGLWWAPCLLALFLLAAIYDLPALRRRFLPGSIRQLFAPRHAPDSGRRSITMLLDRYIGA